MVAVVVVALVLSAGIQTHLLRELVARVQQTA
jgi:hypothetical protein